MNKPAIFIGSSTEGRPIADALHESLRHDGDVSIWNQGVFGLGASTLESLIRQLDRTDFAVLVFTADDLVTSRGAESATARDNVLFELGLFMGRLGRTSAYAFISDADKLKIPSDLHGINFATFRPRGDGDLRKAVADAAIDIRNAIAQEIDRKRDEILSVLSGRLIYLLRQIDQIGDFRHESFYGKAVAYFKCETQAQEGAFSSDPTAWAKASVYACRLLGALRLVEYTRTSGEVSITRLGRDVLADDRTKSRFAIAFSTPPIVI